MEIVKELNNPEMKTQIAMTIREGESDVRNRCHRHKQILCMFVTYEDDVKEENGHTWIECSQNFTFGVTEF